MFRIKSIESIWYTLVLILIQLTCFLRAFSNIRKFDTLKKVWHTSLSVKPMLEIYTYTIMFILNIFLMPFLIWSSLFRTGRKSNDTFKYGIDLDIDKVTRDLTKCLANQNQEKKSSKLKSNNRLSNFSLFSSKSNKLTNLFSIKEEECFFIDELKRRNRLSEKSSVQKFKLILDSLLSYLSKENSSFQESSCPPISSLIHLVMSILFLYPNILLTAKEIEYGLRPKGHVHHTELDFLFNRPFQHQHAQNGTRDNSTSENAKEISYEPFISIESINFILLFLSFTFSYSSCLWYLNKSFTFLFSCHMLLKSCLCVLFYSAYEILYKFQTCFKNNELRFFNNPFTLNLTFFTTLTLIILTSVPIYSLLLMNFDCSFKIMHEYFLNIVLRASSSSNISKICSFDERRGDEQEINSTDVQNKDIGEVIESETDVLLDHPQKENILGSVDKNVGAVVNSKPLLYVKNQKEQKLFNNILTDSLGFTSSSSTSSTTNTNSNDTSPPRSTTNLIRASPSQLQLKNAYASNNNDQAFIHTYRSHILALFLLISLCVNSVFVLYDCIFLFKLTNDQIPFWFAIYYTLFIIWYTFLWLFLTCKKSIKIKLSQSFKLNYWYLLNKLLKSNPDLGLRLVIHNQKANMIQFLLNLKTDDSNNNSLKNNNINTSNKAMLGERDLGCDLDNESDDCDGDLSAPYSKLKSSTSIYFNNSNNNNSSSKKPSQKTSRLKHSSSSPSISTLANNLNRLNAKYENRSGKINSKSFLKRAEHRTSLHLNRPGIYDFSLNKKIGI